MNKEDLKRWFKSFLIALFIFSLISLYLYLRRDFYDIYIINKVLGSTAAILAGITLLIGPLRKLPWIFSLMTIRRQIGLWAFILAVLHIIASLYQTNRFEWFSWYIEEWIPVGFGIFAIIVWSYMTYISRNKKVLAMGPDIWKKQLRFAGNIGFLAIFLHLTIMKYPGWLRFFNGQIRQTSELANPTFPPASLFVFIFMLVVILYRLFTFIFHKKEVQ